MATNRIRIEKVGDVNFVYPYLEVFFYDNSNPFLEIGISDEKQLMFKFYASEGDTSLTVNEWEEILYEAKEFLPKALKDEEDYRRIFKKDQ